jgi:hypothetical protein
MSDTSDRAGSLVQGYAQAIATDLQQAGAPRVTAALEDAGGWSVVVLVFPTPAGLRIPGLSDCERDCLRFLSLTGDSFSAQLVRDEMEDMGIGVYGLATVKRALANLHVRLKLIGNSRRRPRGYWLPEATPLMRLLAKGLPQQPGQDTKADTKQTCPPVQDEETMKESQPEGSVHETPSRAAGASRAPARSGGRVLPQRGTALSAVPGADRRPG